MAKLLPLALSAVLLLAANVVQWGPMPAMTVTASGFGAGTADLGDRPNLTQVVLGTRTGPDGDGPTGQPVLLLETTGRRSGRQRTNALTYLPHGLDMVEGSPVLDIKPYTSKDRKSLIRTGYLASRKVRRRAS